MKLRNWILGLCVLLLLPMQLWAATYYVNAAIGSDANDGSANDAAHAWATLSKIRAAVSLTGTHTVYVATGTYAENTAGLHRWYLDKSYESLTIIGVGTVTVTGDGAGANNTAQGAAIGGITFRNLRFATAVGTTASAFQLVANTGNTVSLTFEDCTFTSDQAAGASAFSITNGSGQPVTGVSFTRCVFSQAKAGATKAAFNIDSLTGHALTMTATDCVFTSTFSACAIERNLATTFTRCVFYGTGASGIGLRLGIDGESGDPVAATVTDCSIRSAVSHTLLVGAGCDGVTISGCSIYGGDHAVVLKASTHVTLENCLLLPGTVPTLLLKGVTNSTIRGNRIIGSNVVAISNDDTAEGFINSGNTLTGNSVIAIGPSGKLYGWTAAKDSGGHVIDGNVYSVGTGAAWGSVNGVTVTSMATLRTAWGDTRDAASTTWSGVRFGWPDAAKVIGPRGDGTNGTYIRPIGHPGVG
jgi:hypothetical protein